MPPDQPAQVVKQSGSLVASAYLNYLCLEYLESSGRHLLCLKLFQPLIEFERHWTDWVDAVWIVLGK